MSTGEGATLGHAILTRRRALVAGLAGLGGLVGAGGCTRGRPTFHTDEQSQAPGEPGTQELQAILDRRAKALKEKNEQAFLADLDASNTKLIQREKLLFANLSQFELRDFHYITERIFGNRSEGNTYTFSPVIAVTQLSADIGPGGVAPAEAYQYLVSKRGDRLVVTDIKRITQANAEKLQAGNAGVYANAPWHLTPLTVVRAGNVWLAGDESVPDLKKYSDAAAAQAREVEALWGNRIKFPGHVLFFTRKRANLRSWYEAQSNTQYEGIEITLRGVRGNGEVYDEQFAGSRVLVNLADIEKWNDNPSLVMRHELTHAVTARGSAVVPGGSWLDSPRWAVEGFARWVENLEVPARQDGQRAIVAQGVRAGKFTGLPPVSKTFYKGDIQFNYALGSSVFAYIERLKGREATIEFYAAVIKYVDLDGEPLVKAPIFNGICRRVLGMGGDAFLGQWAGFVRKGA